MVDCGFQVQLVDSRHASHSPFFILGLMLVCYTTLSSCVKANCTTISSTYRHCRFHPAGVHHLDCFSKHNFRDLKCVWKPGNHTSEKTYTFVVRHNSLSKNREYCEKYENITETFETIRLHRNYNVTAEVFENSKSANCTKTDFRESTNNLLRCGPPLNVSFSRHSGKLDVDVTWQEEDVKVVTFYSVRYKALGNPLWHESAVKSQNGQRCTVENVNCSLVYLVQIQCVINPKFSQCPWSETYTVPAELTAQPEIDKFEERDIAEKDGRRLLYVSWKFPAKKLADSYRVTVGKASEESPYEQMSTTQPEIRLILSYSDFHLNISAVNNASTSPAVSKIIPQREDAPSIRDGRLNVTIRSNTSFTVYWKDDLVKTHVCYSVEWRTKGHKAEHMSFFQNTNNHRTLSPLPKPLEPYKRYTITLHKRPDKETCNMKRINDSESTYGSTQFYLTEGTPVSAPANISSYNVTVNSVVLEWSPILEEDMKGFLLGYTIHYKEYDVRGTERNITVDPVSNCHELGDLKSGTAYQVQISGFTQAGAGVRSMPSLFRTNPEGHFDVNISIIITVFAAVIAVLIFGPAIIKRTKVIVWPSIPNPGNSNAMQKIGRVCELELLVSINTLKVEEWDTNSLQVVEKEAFILANPFPLLHDSDDEGESPHMTCNWNETERTKERSTEDATGGILRNDATDALPQTNLQSFAFPFSSEYTTVEMFNQMMPQSVPVSADAARAEENDPELTGLTVVKSGLDYIGQFGTSPPLKSELSTIL